MFLNRRRFLSTGAGLGLAATGAVSSPHALSVSPASGGDQTATLQAAIDDAARRRVPVELPAGVYRTTGLTLRRGSVIVGAPGLTTLHFIGTDSFLSAKSAAGLRLKNLILDGGMRPLGSGPAAALLAIEGSANIEINAVSLVNSSNTAMAIIGSSGSVSGCFIEKIANAAIFSLDSTISVSANTITNCGNNAIQIWRSKATEDGSQVFNNRISLIRADSGGTGQNGNGINVFRAGNVQISGNRITDCAYSAIRGNAVSDIQMTSNHCQRIGEVALYAEFGFQGAMISNNIIDGAAAGISVTNFNEGGRLAVVQGNLIRNLVRREREPVDKRGEGISVEADTLVTGNTIENAPTCGIVLGWGRHMRDVSATSNLIRGCRVGIMISADPAAGSALVTANMISGATDGAIRAHETGRAVGGDLAKQPAVSGRITIGGNTMS